MQSQLLLKDTISRLKAKYCRVIDEKNWTEFASLIIERPRLQFFGSDGFLQNEFRSTAEFVDATRGLIEGAQTAHQVHNAEIEVVADDEVKAVWSIEDLIVYPRGVHRISTMNAFGHSHETWRLVDGVWRLTDLALRRTILIIKTWEDTGTVN